MSAPLLGFVGLGNMGGPMAANLAAAGIALSVYDQAGTAERAPEGAHRADSAAEVAAATGTVLLSLPDGDASRGVAREIAAAPGRTASVVIDFSTTGLDASRDVHALLAEAGIAYIDAPVSGGTRGAKRGNKHINDHNIKFTSNSRQPYIKSTSSRHQIHHRHIKLT